MNWNSLKVGKSLVLGAIAVALIAGCGGGGGSGGSSPPASALVSGIASKGPLNGSTVCAYAIVGNAKGNQIGTCVTNIADGRYSIDLGTYTGPVLFEATGGTYVDEATGSSLALTIPLRSMLDNASGSAANVAITPLTELAYLSATSAGGGLSTVAIKAAIATVQANFGVSDIVQTQPSNALSVAPTATGAQKTYALALATLSQYQKAQPAGSNSLETVLQILKGCLSSPTTGCGSGNNTVAVSLDSAQHTFQASHQDLASLTLTVTNFGALVSPSANADLTFSASSLTFPETNPGSISLTQTVTVTNIGAATMSNLNVSWYYPSSFVVASNCGASLAAGANCTITVTFNPIAYTADGFASTRGNQVAIQHDGITLTTIGFYGTVPALPKPALQITPSSLTFPSQAYGVGSAPQTITLTNTGAAPLNFSCFDAPPIIGSGLGQSIGSSNCGVINLDQLYLPRDYSLTKTCVYQSNLSYPPTDTPGFSIQPVANLAPGQSCTVNVVFTPRADGARNSVLVIMSNASADANVTLTGGVSGATYQSAYDTCYIGTPALYSTTYCAAYANAIVAGSTPLAANQAGAVAAGSNVGNIGMGQPIDAIGTPYPGGTGGAISATANTTAQNLTVGTAMASFSPLTPSGGATPYTYSYTGTLPTGLSFSASTGAVTGTPTAAYATANLVFSVRDANNNYANTTSTVSFTVSAASGLPAGYVVQGGLTWTPASIFWVWDTWTYANAYCANTTINGQTGWRLPTQPELSALYTSGVMNGQGWTLGFTWSSTVYSAGGHYGVFLSNGYVSWDDDTSANYVSCVR